MARAFPRAPLPAARGARLLALPLAHLPARTLRLGAWGMNLHTRALGCRLPAPPPAGAFSRRDSLARAVRPRLYHSSAVLLPSCQVMVSGSDVSVVQ